MTAKHTRYHVKLNPGYRIKGGMADSKSGFTTVALNKTLTDLLSIKLKIRPDSKESHAVVTRYLQEELINPDMGRSSKGLSHYLTTKVILLISDNMLSTKYDKYVNSEYDENGEFPV